MKNLEDIILNYRDYGKIRRSHLMVFIMAIHYKEGRERCRQLSNMIKKSGGSNYSAIVLNVCGPEMYRYYLNGEKEKELEALLGEECIKSAETFAADSLRGSLELCYELESYKRRD